MRDETTDILTEISTGVFNFVPGPCDPDIQAPEDLNYTPDINNTTRMLSMFGLSFLLRDGDNYTKNQPGYRTDSLVLNDVNYRKNEADRALGINTGKLILQFIYP